MSEMQDRLRRLVNMRPQRTHPTPSHAETDIDADVDVDINLYTDRMTSTPADLDLEDRSERRLLPLHRLVPGYEVVNAAGLCYCTVQAFPLEESRGPNPLGSLLALPPALFHRFHPTFGLGEMADYRRAAFIDTETTGLGGGAGVYCFMVGVGSFEAYQPHAADQLPAVPDRDTTPTHFVVRQFLMRKPA